MELNAKHHKGPPLEPNAFTLFLILILLIMGSGSYQIEERLSHFSKMIRASHNAVKMMRAGMNEFRSSMMPPNSSGMNNNIGQ